MQTLTKMTDVLREDDKVQSFELIIISCAIDTNLPFICEKT